MSMYICATMDSKVFMFPMHIITLFFPIKWQFPNLSILKESKKFQKNTSLLQIYK